MNYPTVDTGKTENDLSQLTEQVIGACIAVHRTLGPGLLESAYQRCLAIEFNELGFHFDEQALAPITYKGVTIADAYRLDFLINGALVVEIKAVDALEAVHTAQTLTYMRAVQAPLGLLINFNKPRLVDGIKRLKL